VWEDAQEKMMDVLSRKSFAELAKEEREAQSALAVAK
jgi:DNA-binding IscR family transcriptional regulator